MLSDEENKAIKIAKGITEDDLLNYWEGPEEPYNAIQTILNLIEKQSKEIEEVKDSNNKLYSILQENKKQTKYSLENNDKKWEDKIKAKIEEVDMTGEIGYLVKGILHSLLEKE